MMQKPRVLLIKTGGTIAQKPGKDGYLEPSPDEYLYKVEGVHDLTEIDIIDLSNVDSTNMETNIKSMKPDGEKIAVDRATMANVIYKNAFKYDGFVVVHGTDTMAETAAALTYMLPDLKKPIVLTGSQRPIWMPGSDGSNNVYMLSWQ